MFNNPAWLFSLATIIACGGIVIVFRNLMSKIVGIIGAEDEVEALQREAAGFFIKTAIIEIIPIILLIIGILKMKDFTGTFDDMFIPLIIALAVYIFSLVVIYLSASQTKNEPNLSEMLKVQTSSFMMMGIAVSSTFPLIAFVMIYLAG